MLSKPRGNIQPVPIIPSSYLSQALDDSRPKKYFSNIPPIPTILQKKSLTSNNSFSGASSKEADTNRSISPLKLRSLKERLIHEYGEDFQELKMLRKARGVGREKQKPLTQSPNVERMAALA